MKKIFNVLYFIITTYLLYSLFNYNIEFNGSLVYVIAIMYIIAITFIYKKVLDLKITKYMFIITYIILLFFQIIIAYLFETNPIWDLEVIYKDALDFNNLINDVSYFSIYTNNIPILMLIKGLFYIVKCFNCYNYNEVGIFLNIISINISIIFTVLVINEIYDKNKAFFALIFITLTPIIYLSVPIYYTDTLSMPFPIIAIYLYLKFSKKENKKDKILFSFLLALNVFLGMNLKATVGIVYIAIIIYDIFISKYSKKIEILYPILSIITFITLINFEKILFKNVFKEYIPDIENNSYPVTHYLVMGLHNDGGYNKEDNEIALRNIGRQEKTNEDLKLIKNNLEDLDNIKKVRKFFTNKAGKFWSDGTYESNVLLSIAPYRTGKFQDLIYKNNSEYIYISQIQRIALVILICISMFNKKDRVEKINYICRITIVGIIIFFSFWEINSRYLLNYFTIFIVLQTIGIDFVNKNLIKIEQTYKKRSKPKIR